MNKILRLSFIAVMALVCGTMSAQTELLENGGFETWKDGVATNWQSSTTASSKGKLVQSTDARTGDYAALLKCDPNTNPKKAKNVRMAYKELNLKAGTYKMSFYAKGGQVKPGYAISVNGSIDGQNGYKYGSYADLSATEWTLVEHEFTLEAPTTVNIVVMNPKDNNNKGYKATDAIIDDFSLTTTDGGIDGTVAPPADITNTPETAYTVAKAFELIEAGEGLNAKVYVKGKISAITEVETEKFFNATYNISDNGTTEGQQLIVFHGKYIGGANFESKDQINIGDEVIVYGQLVNFKGKYEINSNNQIYSINGVTAGVQNITVEQNVNAPAFNLAGQRVNAAYKGIVVKNGKKFLNK